MKNLILTLLFQISVCSHGQNIWIQKDAVNGPPRSACMGFSLNNEAFVIGGVNFEEFKRKAYSYDLEQNDWDDEIPLGGEAGAGLERASGIGFSANGYGFIGLGTGAAGNLNDLWRYDPETETWTQMANFQGTARKGAVAFSIDDIGYAGTGQDNSGPTNDFYAYHPLSNTWEVLADFEGVPRKEAVGFRMGGKGYLGTGRGNSTYLVDFWEYNPVADEWNQKADFPGTPRMGAVGCGVFPSAFILLGEDNASQYKSDVWEYNYFGNVWSQRASFPGGGRSQANAFIVNNRIFVGLGYDGTFYDDFYEYDKILSIPSLKTDFALAIYPNPVIDICFLTSNTSLIGSQFDFYDVSGKNVSRYFESLLESENTLKIIPIKHIPNGIYYLSIWHQNQTVNIQKFVLK